MFKILKNRINKSIFTLLSLSILLLLSGNAFANQNVEKIGDLEIHYIGLPSIVLQPEIAKHYAIERSRYNGFVNISVLDTSKKNKPAKRVGVSGSATNLVGQKIPLEFQQVIEGEAIYYLATIKYPNDETYRFNILINDNGKQHRVKFTQKFYVNQ